MDKDVKRLGQALVGLYRVVRLQQEGIDRFISASEAILDAMKHIDARFEPAFEKCLAQGMNANKEVRATSRLLIDETIASLEKEYGPWKN